jgi:hypothetical protein
VTVTGKNFTGATAVHFSTASFFTVSSRTQIAATSPAGSTGAVDVTVTTPAGTSTTSSADHFIYTSSTGTTYYVSNGGSDRDGGNVARE